MATKSKRKRNKNRSSKVPALELARRCFERGELKEALKQAKLAYRQDASTDRRALLECIYVARVQQLAERGARDDAGRLLDELLALGVTDASVEAGLSDLLVSVGRIEKALEHASREGAEAGDKLEVRVCDQAVLHLEDIPDSATTVREQGQAIRTALDLLYAGEMDQAIRQLSGIGRQSPFADWVFFVRGLAAYYREDYEKMRAAWRRLDPTRPAARIAAPLIELANGTSWHEIDGALQRRLKHLEYQLTGRVVLPHLAEFSRKLGSEPDAATVIPALRSLRIELKKTDPNALQHISRVVTSRFVRTGDVDALRQVTRLLEAPPHDPHWHATVALTKERDFETGNPFEAHLAWQVYLEHLPAIRSITTDDRRVIGALVGQHIGQMVSFVRSALERIGLVEDEDEDEDDEGKEEALSLLFAEAIDCFEKAIEQLPQYVPLYADLAKVLIDDGRATKALEVYERALRQVPDHVETLTAMAELAAKRDAPERMFECAKRLHELQPLDAKYLQLLWEAQLEMARKYAMTGQFEAGNTAFAAADRLLPKKAEQCDVQARKVAFAYATGDVVAAHKLIGKVVDQLAEPTAFWLMLAIEFFRYGLPENEQQLYEKRWREALSRRRRVATMALMCDTINREWSRVDDPESPSGKLLDRYRRLLLPYVQRGGNLKWTAEQLRSICWFVIESEDQKTLTRFSNSGLRKFPDEPLFHACRALAELVKPYYSMNLSVAQDEIERAVQLSHERTGTKDPQLAELLDSLMARTEKMRMVMRTPFDAFFGGFGDEFFDDDDDDDDEFF